MSPWMNCGSALKNFPRTGICAFSAKWACGGMSLAGCFRNWVIDAGIFQEAIVSLECGSAASRSRDHLVPVARNG
jgi:hypothetical protein